MSDTIPRRNHLDKCTVEERQLYQAVWDIETLGAHPLLTDCVTLIAQARNKLSDWIDEGCPGRAGGSTSPIADGTDRLSTTDSANCSPNESSTKANNQTDLVNNTEDK